MLLAAKMSFEGVKRWAARDFVLSVREIDSEGFLGTPDTADIDFDGTSEGELIPTTMRAGSHQGYDRVVIEFAGAGIPRWWD